MRRSIALPVLLLGVLAAPASAADGARPANDDIENAIAIGALPFAHETDTTRASTQRDEPQPTCQGWPGATVWYRFSPTADTEVVAKTLGSDFDTFVAVWERPTPLRWRIGGPLRNWQVACGNDAAGQQSMVGFIARAGRTYLIQVGGWGPLTGHLRFSLRSGTYAGAAVVPGIEVGTGGDDEDRVTTVQATGFLLPYVRAWRHEGPGTDTTRGCAIVGFSGVCAYNHQGEGRRHAYAETGVFPAAYAKADLERADGGGGTARACVSTWPVQVDRCEEATIP